MSVKDLVKKGLRFFDYKKSKQEKRVEELLSLQKNLKKKREKLEDNFKKSSSKDQEQIQKEIKAINTIYKKTKKLLKELN